MLKELFQFVLDNYITEEKKVSSASALYRVLVDEIRIEIRSIFPFRKDLIVKGSMGQGNKTDYPWVSTLNKNITSTTKTGLYIVYLFKKDMSGFYLTLDQGITYFTDAYGKKKYESARKVVKYFQDHINDDYFSKELIKLGAKKINYYSYMAREGLKGANEALKNGVKFYHELAAVATKYMEEDVLRAMKVFYNK